MASSINVYFCLRKLVTYIDGKLDAQNVINSLALQLTILLWETCMMPQSVPPSAAALYW